jgi:hypothetical protein
LPFCENATIESDCETCAIPVDRPTQRETTNTGNGKDMKDSDIANSAQHAEKTANFRVYRTLSVTPVGGPIIKYLEVPS